MRTFPRPRVVVSACLEFEHVRYDGQMIPCRTVRELMDFVDFIKVCPEYEIGLGVPREPIRIVRSGDEYRLIQPKTERDVTKEMDEFTDNFMASLPDVDGFIFKSKSPTIGLKNIKVYRGAHDPNVVERRSGFFAQKILDRYHGYPIEEDQRLNNNKIKHNFLTALYAFADFRQVRESGSMEALHDFHNRNRYLFMAYSPALYMKMNGAFKDEKPIEKYFELLRELFADMPSHVEYIDVASTIFNRYDTRATDKEKSWFYEAMEKYEKNKISLNGLLESLLLFAEKFDDVEILKQTLFEPYPLELMPDVDTERDREYAIM
ncbi:DUF1722 domain-containing protein [Methanocella sp. CWC-04]|uniref:DUF1722 domain-containing protein n=1 Tax=Methanooceanicella nereidis TaxID=2052831 RepID=A0AAP2W3V2_9EURY|nr:DUF523 and DUF1722 domain-containing protein [Methanocella sp. CWC-04]MCD1293535.1 DUF1722 domain-containing protein [Methanocella sp. CWC-04]